MITNMARIVVMTGVMLFTTIISAQSDNIMVTGYTTDVVNLRSGPGSGFDVIRVLPYRTAVTFTGRNQSGTWLKAAVNDLEGWLSYTFVRVDGNVNSLPIFAGVGALPVRGSSTSTVLLSSLPDGVVPQISETTRRIFQRGQEMGNYADVFSKVGDSITASNLFLDPIGNGAYNLYEYAHLEAVIRYFSQTPLRDHYSFANTSLAARGGWTTTDVLDPRRGMSGICQSDESPLACEYRINKPAIALIMLGTNDVVNTSSSEYQNNMNRIVQLSIDMGVIPVVSTLPDQPGTPQAERVIEFNDIIREIAQTYDIPLWDYWLALQGLPNQGISSDNIHPSYNYTTSATAYFAPDDLRYGYNMRNLTALMVLDIIWREVIE